MVNYNTRFLLFFTLNDSYSWIDLVSIGYLTHIKFNIMNEYFLHYLPYDTKIYMSNRKSSRRLHKFQNIGSKVEISCFLLNNNLAEIEIDIQFKTVIHRRNKTPITLM